MQTSIPRRRAVSRHPQEAGIAHAESGHHIAVQEVDEGPMGGA